MDPAAPLTLVLRALAFASHKHAGQRRKGVREIPYIDHPLRVAALLAEVGVTDAEVLAAAALHDTVEDTGTTREELEQQFGPAVALLVLEVTDDKSLPKEVRKERQVEHAPHLSRGARLVKLADKICNLRDLSDDPPTEWPLERLQAYFDWAGRVAAGLRGVDARLEQLFDEASSRRPR